MSNLTDLYSDDLDKIIKTCAEFTMAAQIKDLIDLRVKKYGKDNPNMIRDMLVRVEILYPADIANSDYVDGFYQEDVFNFDEEYPNLRNAPIVWLESYLFEISNNRNYQCGILWGDTENKHSAILYADALKTFDSRLNVEQLIQLHEYLTKHEFLARTSPEHFVSIFSGVELTPNVKPLCWLARYRNGVYFLALFELIKNICPSEYLRVKKDIFFFKKLETCFLKYNGKKILAEDAQSRFSKWKRKNHTEEILSEEDYRDPVHNLIKYLQSLS